MLDINFFEEALDYINNAPEKPKTEPEAVKINNSIEADAEQQACNKQSLYSISTDANQIIIKGNSYNIPSYFNREAVAQKDKKTIDMLLIYFNFEDLIEKDSPQDARKATFYL